MSASVYKACWEFLVSSNPASVYKACWELLVSSNPNQVVPARDIQKTKRAQLLVSQWPGQHVAARPSHGMNWGMAARPCHGTAWSLVSRTRQIKNAGRLT